ncbi:hypothetical protein FH620_00280 [Corallococcus exiguus]|nr:hypothetical protein FH620_00280 [Corallococcus exiguus]
MWPRWEWFEHWRLGLGWLGLKWLGLGWLGLELRRLGLGRLGLRWLGLGWRRHEPLTLTRRGRAIRVLGSHMG